MFLIRAIPLTRLPPHAPSVLDYFWPTELAVGCIVKAAMGRRTVSAIVVDVRDVRSAKIAVKSADFSLKRLEAVVTPTPQLSSGQLALARWLSAQYSCSLATALKTVAPASVGSRTSRMDHSPADFLQKPVPTAGTVVVTQPDTAVRRITDILADSTGQVLILVPEQSLTTTLASLIPAHPVIMHSGLTPSRARALYKGVLDGSVRAVIGTRAALFLPWSRLTHIIVEDPLSELYKSDMSPRYNAPDVARQLAALHGAQLTWLTPALSTVQHHLRTTGVLEVQDDKPYWPAVTITSSQVETESGHRSLFSRAAQDALLDAHERGAPVLIFSSRRAYATVARCGRCAKAALCPSCDIPMRWHRTSEDLLVCYHCTSFRTVPRQCESCHGGALKASGIPGSQKLAEAVNVILDRFGKRNVTIPVLDSDLVLSEGDAERMLAQLDAMEHPVLIATPMINSRRYTRRFDTVIVPHLDALTVNPDYRTQDRLIVQLEKLADFRPERMIIQTHDETALSTLIAARKWHEFFQTELPYRKSLRWPPYTRIVKLSVSHRDRGAAVRAAAAGADRMKRAAAHMNAQGTQILGPSPALVEKSGGRWTQHLIIKSSLPSSRLSELLQYVPEQWTVDVDPRSIS